ncbi:MAG: Dihydrofolate synthase/folylpolyglutamate synthase [Chlamydiia bacterium]|nr:Dihydrofolate synthase/folylpolyglutamate synthase [Chlamydiia bacterium]
MEYKRFYESLCKRTNPKKSLDKIRKAHNKIGSPGDKLKVIHLTGTNGKGSVGLNIARGLEKNGLKVGLFSSPHYERINERISINSVLISDEEMEDIYQKHRQVFHTLNFFEYLTLAAFVYFAKSDIDYAIIEVGIGGLKDSTNILDAQLSVITNISIDHQNFLGTDEESIAFQKSGIIKEGKPVVLGPKVNHEIIFQIAKEKNAQVHKVKNTSNDYLEENRSIANLVLEVLGYRPLEKLYQLPARFEVVENMIFDMAHNKGAFRALKEKVKILYPNKKIIALWNMSPLKQYVNCLEILKSFVDKVYFFSSNSERLLTVKDAQKLNLEVFEDQVSDVYLVCGSIYFMKEAKKSLMKKKQLQKQ